MEYLYRTIKLLDYIPPISIVYKIEEKIKPTYKAIIFECKMYINI